MIGPYGHLCDQGLGTKDQTNVPRPHGGLYMTRGPQIGHCTLVYLQIMGF
jgi:hypothetical protein